MLAVGVIFLGGCQGGIESIDSRVNTLMSETAAGIGGGAVSPEYGHSIRSRAGADLYVERPTTENPMPESLEFIAAPPSGAKEDVARVMGRLEQYSRVQGDALEMNLAAALAYAFKHSRDYRFAEEEFVLASLRLLIERHQWGPRFFNDTTVTASAVGDNGLFDSSLRLVNEFRVTQRLPYGGEVSARALASATEDLHQAVSGEKVQTADIILAANIPLLRGAGQTARESRIQQERNVVYAARTFERFRREFIFSIATDFLDLIVRQRSIENAERQVESLQDLAARETALFQSGRNTRFDAALAEQRTVVARDSLNNQRENDRLAVDRFKVQLGMPTEQALVLLESSLNLPTPEIDIEDVVRMAMTYRLDLQTERDRVIDRKRAVLNARNDLLPDLDLSGSVSIPTDGGKDRAGLDFAPDDTSFTAGITFGLPLDREIERLSVRTTQINYERAVRNYEEFADNLAVTARAATRDIDRALFSLDIQRTSIRIAEDRLASIKAAPGRVTPRDSSDAVDDLNRARNDYDRAYRDLQVALLRYLLESGQLRVDEDGAILPLRGMEMSETEEKESSEALDRNP